MKCPKCDYLGFDTGDRCRNCGYDFSLAAGTRQPVREPDLPLRLAEPVAPGPNSWLEQLDRGLQIVPAVERAADPLAPLPADTVVAAPAPNPAQRRASDVPTAAAPVLPLFTADPADDEPLIKVPSAPRPPLAVRRTPQRPRLRPVPKTAEAVASGAAVAVAEVDPVLEFPEAVAPVPERAAADPAPRPRRPPATGEPCPRDRRLLGAAIDLAILLSIDAAVVYFTLKMAQLESAEWPLLPIAPLAAFLAIIKVAYFCAFTLFGGQTVGKMALRTRVVCDRGAPLDPIRAMQRSVVALLSILPLGAGFIPAFIAADRRALHDRLARTRVIALP